MSRKRGTYLVEFIDGSKVIFGNNYKDWWQHATEYIFYNKGDREAIKENGWRYKYVERVIRSVQYSNQQFYDDGGLKWCGITAYQSVINEVCKRDKLAPVNVNDIIFIKSPSNKSVLTKKLKEW